MLNLVLDYTNLFSSLITRCAKDIDALIESLPNDDTSTDLQVCIVVKTVKSILDIVIMKLVRPIQIYILILKLKYVTV